MNTTALGPAQDAMPTTRGLNFYVEDRNFQRLCETVMDGETFERARPHLVDMGELAGGELDALAAVADRNPPTLRTHDERGQRIDEVVRHAAYRRMEQLAFSRFGLAAMSHRSGVLGWPGRVPHVVKYALTYLFSQSEFGLLCPVNVTDSTSRMLRLYGSEELRETYLPLLTSTDFDEMWQGTQGKKNLYENIDKRVDEMIEQGFVDEVKNILSKGYDKNLNSLNTVGYKEIIQYLDGIISLERAIELTKAIHVIMQSGK